MMVAGSIPNHSRFTSHSQRLSQFWSLFRIRFPLINRWNIFRLFHCFAIIKWGIRMHKISVRRVQKDCIHISTFQNLLFKRRSSVLLHHELIWGKYEEVIKLVCTLKWLNKYIGTPLLRSNVFQFQNWKKFWRAEKK